MRTKSNETDDTPRQVQRRVRPRIVCFCGSSRFVDIMAVLMWTFERDEGVICMGLHLLPQWYRPDGFKDCPPDHIAEVEGYKDRMDELHLRKIDLADEVFVVNKDGYIGESTAREIEYAKIQGKPVKYLEGV